MHLLICIFSIPYVVGRIRVYVRVRPLNENEVKAGYKDVLTKEDDRTIVMAADQATSTEVKDWEFDKIFSGSHVHGNTQEAVFDDTSLLITSAIDGFNVCIFAYGQTGSGEHAPHPLFPLGGVSNPIILFRR